MEDNNFDLCILGTSIENCLLARQHKCKKVIVIEKKETYGTSFKYKKCIIESRPRLIRSHDLICDVLRDMNIHLLIDFVIVRNHFYIKDKTIYKIPINKNEISESNFLTRKDMFYLNQSINNNNCVFIDKLSKKAKDIFVKAICGGIFDPGAFSRFARSFGTDFYLLYPIHGFKDISEKISRCNALNGISYLLDKTLNYEDNNERVIINSKYGQLYSKKIETCKAKIRNTRKFYVLNYNDEFYDKRFFGVFDIGELIFCITLDHESAVCKEDTYLIYLWKEIGEITDHELINIGIETDKIIERTHFDSNEDFKYDSILGED
ncbi:hypothetical protein COBT_003260 [Conglomerata obtusa]